MERRVVRGKIFDGRQLGNRNKGLKHCLTVSEALTTLEQQKVKSKKQAKRTPLQGFHEVKTGKFTWAGSNTTGLLDSGNRRASLADMFLKLCPSEVAEVMIEEHELTRTKGEHHIKVLDVQEYWCVRIWLQRERNSIKLRENWPLDKSGFPGTFGHHKYDRLQKLWMSPKVVEILNAKAAARVSIVPEVITIDEKLKKFSGDTPYRRYVPNKNPPTGHWITEATMKGPHTGLPYLIAAFPIQQHQGPSMLEMYQTSLSWIARQDRKNVVVVTDAYYMDDASRKWLRDNDFKYLAAINPTRFKEVWGPLERQIKHCGDGAVHWNDETGEAAVHIKLESGYKIYLLTNAFTYQLTQQPVNYTIFSDVYSHCFNTADRLNHFIGKKGYPYRRIGWQYSFDGFHFTTLLWNVYVLYHEQYNEVDMSWKEFCEQLAKELWEIIHNK